MKPKSTPLAVVALALAVAGCGGGMRAGSEAVCASGTLYFDKIDLDMGGVANRDAQLAGEGRAFLIGQTRVRIEKFDGDAAFVRLLSPEVDYQRDATGWVRVKDLDPSAEALESARKWEAERPERRAKYGR